jgi:hypothetical protein
MSARKRLTKQLFYAINRDIKYGSKVSTIALNHHVSEETVRTIKRVKTWPRFEAMKKLKNERRRPSTTKAATQPAIPGLSAADAVENATKNLDKITQAPENQIRPVPSAEIKEVTVAEWEDVQRKLGLLYTRMDQLRAAQLQRKPLLSIFRRTK